MHGIQLCQICKEPINNHICSDCISENIKKVLPAELRHHVSDFHRMVSRTFRFRGGMRHCIKCGLSDAPSLCIVCYLKEFLSWSKWVNPQIRKEIKNKMRFRLSQKVEKRGFVPLTSLEDNMAIDGICESCECYSDRLHQVEGMWLCEECMEFVKRDDVYGKEV